MAEKIKNDVESYCRMALVSVSKMYIGVREVGGNNRGEFVEMFQKAVDGKASGEPWCAGYVMYCMKAAQDLVETIFQSSFLKPLVFQSEHVMTIWNKTDAKQRRSVARPGDLLVFQHYRSNKQTASGHIEIVLEADRGDGKLLCIGGNTSDSSGVVREGDGVFVKLRSYKENSGSMRVRGILAVWPEFF